MMLYLGTVGLLVYFTAGMTWLIIMVLGDQEYDGLVKSLAVGLVVFVYWFVLGLAGKLVFSW